VQADDVRVTVPARERDGRVAVRTVRHEARLGEPAATEAFVDARRHALVEAEVIGMDYEFGHLFASSARRRT
jgi:hypothetical protein